MHRALVVMGAFGASACGRIDFVPVVDAGQQMQLDAAFASCATTPNLVGYWPFDETAGALVHDVSASQQHADISGAVSFVAGHLGGAIELGPDGSVKLQHTAGLSFDGGTGSWTLSYWLAPASLTNVTKIRPFEVAYCGGSAYVLTFIDPDGTTAFSGYDAVGNYAATASPAGALQIGRWTHVAHVIDRVAKTGQTFIDGVPGAVDDMSTWATPIDCSNATLAPYIGGWADFDYVGRIDDLRIYDRVLAANEVTALANLAESGCP